MLMRVECLNYTDVELRQLIRELRAELLKRQQNRSARKYLERNEHATDKSRKATR